MDGPNKSVGTDFVLPAENEFRHLLQEDYLRRLERNAKYSLRAYAQFLGINSGSLSQIFLGKRELSRKMSQRLGLKIGLDPAEIAKSIGGYERSEPGTNALASAVQPLSIDYFRVIADWYHFAILELFLLNSFQSEPSWIGKTLGITGPEANMALERLERLELIDRTNAKKWKLLKQNLSTFHIEFEDGALKKLQKEFLNRAMNQLETVEISRRDNSSLTVAIHRDDIPWVKEQIRKFRRRLNQGLSKATEKNDVYNLSIAFFPLTEVGPNLKKNKH